MSDERAGNVAGFAITRSKGFHLRFENGWTASVQFGPYNYCSNYDRPAFALAETALALGAAVDLEASTAEIAAWHYVDGVDVCYEFDGDSVAGYKTPAEVLAFLTEIASLPK